MSEKHFHFFGGILHRPRPSNAILVAVCASFFLAMPLFASPTVFAERAFDMGIQAPEGARSLDVVSLIVRASWSEANNTTFFEGNVSLRITQGVTVLFDGTLPMSSGLLRHDLEIPCSPFPEDVFVVAALTVAEARHEAQVRIAVEQSNGCAALLDREAREQDARRTAVRDAQDAAFLFGTLAIALLLNVVLIVSLQHRWAVENRRLSFAERILIRSGFRWTEEPLAQPPSTHMEMVLDRFRRRLRLKELNGMVEIGEKAKEERAKHDEKVAILSLHINEERMNRGQKPEKDYVTGGKT